MRNAVLFILLTFAAPGLLLPGGFDVRMCFCGGKSGGCCLVSETKSGCPRCAVVRASKTPSRAPVIAKAAAPCPGCVRLTVPASAPRSTAPLPTTETAAPPMVAATLVPATARVALLAEPAVLWHPPPGNRFLPLLI